LNILRATETFDRAELVLASASHATAGPGDDDDICKLLTLEQASQLRTHLLESQSYLSDCLLQNEGSVEKFQTEVFPNAPDPEQEDDEDAFVSVKRSLRKRKRVADDDEKPENGRHKKIKAAVKVKQEESFDDEASDNRDDDSFNPLDHNNDSDDGNDASPQSYKKELGDNSDGEEERPIVKIKLKSKPKQKRNNKKSNGGGKDLASNDLAEPSVIQNNLKKLIRMYCLWPKGRMVPADFDIGQGLPNADYGIRMHGKLAFVVMFLMLESPIFLQRSNAVEFFVELGGFSQAETRSFITRVYKLFAMNLDVKAAAKLNLGILLPFANEIAANGFSVFNPFTADDVLAYTDPEWLLRDPMTEIKDVFDVCLVAPSSRLLHKALPNFNNCKRNRARIHNIHEKFKAQRLTETLEYLNSNQPLRVKPSSKGSFRHMLINSYISDILPEMWKNNAFAVVAVKVEETDGISPPTFEAKVLARSASANFAAIDYPNLHGVMVESLGLTVNDVYRNSFPLDKVGTNKYYWLPATDIQCLERLSPEDINAKGDEIGAKMKVLSTPAQRNKLVDLPESEFSLVFSDDSCTDYSVYNNISILMGETLSSVSARTLLTEEGMTMLHFKKPKQNKGREEAKKSKEGEVKKDNLYARTIPRFLLDVFCTVNGLSSSSLMDNVPEFKRMFGDVKHLHSVSEAVEKIRAKPPGIQSSVVCEHCGKEFEKRTQTQRRFLSHHLAKCKLERMNCDCKGIKFENARDKRRHMLLHHSDKKQFGCNMCKDIFGSQRHLDEHFLAYHGLPGQGVVCDLCRKTFPSNNHLRIHSLCHEIYLCVQCNCVEILGRQNFKKHNKDYHDYGVSCQSCGKWYATQAKLNYHITLNHEDASYLNAE